jgi:3D (Asp-Asp-Asp) domain-containing protein/LysM repeat protein
MGDKRMLNKMKTLIAAVALSGTVSANAQAATFPVQNGDTLSYHPSVQNTSVENLGNWNHLITDIILPKDALTNATKKHDTVKQDATLWDKVMNYNVNVSQIKEWNKLITDFIHPGSNLFIFDGLNTNKAVKIEQEKPTAPVAALSRPTLAKVEAIATAPSTATTKVEAAPKATASSPAQAKVEAAPKATALSPAPAKVEAAPKATALSPAQAKVEAAPKATASSPAPAKAEATPKATEPSPAPAAQAPKESTPATTDNRSSKEITVKATAYTASCTGCSGITATGINIKANPNEKVIAVDPSVIPLGSKVYVEGFGEATAEDTGGAIKGNRIDVFIPSEQGAVKFGVKQLKVKILN